MNRYGQLNLEGKTKIEVAIARLQEFEPPEGYYFADSYGKDSCVTRRLLQLANSKFETYHAHTGLDAPELVMFGRECHPEVIEIKPLIVFWKALLMPAYGILPQRQRRWCCELLKESGGAGRRVVTGIRWEESGSRKKRRLFEVCKKDATKYFLNPIIDWLTAEVWEFIRAEKLPYCSLYDEGFKRLGCVLCPMVGGKQLELQIKRFPKQVETWHRNALRLYDAFPERFIDRWQNGEQMWKWWLSRKGMKDDAQCVMFDN